MQPLPKYFDHLVYAVRCSHTRVILQTVKMEKKKPGQERVLLRVLLTGLVSYRDNKRLRDLSSPVTQTFGITLATVDSATDSIMHMG